MVTGAGVNRIVQRCNATTVPARRSDTPNRSRSATTALRERFGVRVRAEILFENTDVEGLVDGRHRMLDKRR